MERVHERLLGTYKLKDLVERGTLKYAEATLKLR